MPSRQQNWQQKEKDPSWFDGFCPSNNHDSIHILLIVLKENNQHVSFKHNCGFKADYVFPEILVHGGTSASAHPYKYTPCVVNH